MSEHLAWAQWWACPLRGAHPDWQVAGAPSLPTSLQRSHPAQVNALFQIHPCLPPFPSPALLQLLHATGEQRELMLMLIKGVYHASPDSLLSQEQQLWCRRLAKALAPSPTLDASDDPLHYLRAWVEPAVWQRLRLSFARERVLALETLPRLSDSHSRLNTLWQAALWRVTGAAHDTAQHALP